MRRYIKIAVILAVAAAGMGSTATASFAHGLWVQQMDGAYAVCRGIFGKGFEPYDPSRVTRISAKAVDGDDLAVTRANEKERAVFNVDAKPALVAVTSEWGDRVNTTRGKKLIGRRAAEAAGFTVVSAFTSTQYSKTLFAPSAVNCRSLGLRFELVPLADPMTLSPGGQGMFKLLFDGRPLEGILILTGDGRETPTDARGVARLSFEKGGEHLLYAVYEIPAEKSSDYDFRKFMTFLKFEVK